MTILLPRKVMFSGLNEFPRILIPFMQKHTFFSIKILLSGLFVPKNKIINFQIFFTYVSNVM